jgi:hypothetical protein
MCIRFVHRRVTSHRMPSNETLTNAQTTVNSQLSQQPPYHPTNHMLASLSSSRTTCDNLGFQP